MTAMKAIMGRDRVRCALSVVVPVYNEEACLDELHCRISAVVRKVAGDSHEIVLINDGSNDSSWEVMRRLAARDPNIVAVNLSRNHGHQLALTAGLDVARGDAILIIDADLQDPPELLPDMLATMQREQADVVYGLRVSRAGESSGKTLSAALFYRLLARITDTDIPVDVGDFRLMSRRALDALLSLPEQSRFMRGMVAWIGFKQVPFSYDRAQRHAGETHYPLAKMVRLALDAVTGFSIAPLRLASHAGLALTAMSGLIVVFIGISWLRGNTIAGWTSLMLVIICLGAVQMFVLGLIGEYLGRVYIEAKHRPLYIVADVVTAANAAPQRDYHVDRMATSETPGGIGILPTR